MGVNRKTFDFVLLMAVAVHATFALPKMWAARVSNDPTQTGKLNTLAGAVNILA